MQTIPENKTPMKKSLLFMFSGKAGVGKTFSSEFVVSELSKLDYNAAKISFAYGVKKIATLMGWNGVKDQKGRRLLQGIGQVGRMYDENTWVADTINRLDNAPLIYDVVCIDDVRFPNEYTYVRDTQPLFKPVLIRIESKDREILKGTPEAHEISEIALDNYELFDYVVQNPVYDNSYILKALTEIVGLEVLKNR